MGDSGEVVKNERLRIVTRSQYDEGYLVKEGDVIRMRHFQYRGRTLDEDFVVAEPADREGL